MTSAAPSHAQQDYSETGPQRRRLWILCAATVAGTLAFDLVTKAWAWETLRPPGQSIWIWEPWIEFSFALNTGTAFSLIREISAPWIMVPIVVIEIAFILYISIRNKMASALWFVCTGLIMGGALGNLHDRFARFDEAGRPGVVDFIKIYYPWGGSWPVFNIADSALVVGAIVLLFAMRQSPATSSNTQLEAKSGPDDSTLR